MTRMPREPTLMLVQRLAGKGLLPIVEAGLQDAELGDDVGRVAVHQQAGQPRARRDHLPAA